MEGRQGHLGSVAWLESTVACYADSWAEQANTPACGVEEPLHQLHADALALAGRQHSHLQDLHSGNGVPGYSSVWSSEGRAFWITRCTMKLLRTGILRPAP